MSREDANKISREDAYKITREDVLRELELMPVWTLRVPLSAQVNIEPTQPVLEVVADINNLEPDFIEQDLIEAPKAVSNAVDISPAALITSDDRKWLFVLPAELSGQAADLFNNILRALNIKKTQTSHSQQLAQDIASLNVGAVVVMGEKMAQQLFASAQSLESLRGKMHVVNGLQVMATYHPDDLLLHLANKAKTWDDLCSALDVINR